MNSYDETKYAYKEFDFPTSTNETEHELYFQTPEFSSREECDIDMFMLVCKKENQPIKVLIVDPHLHNVISYAKKIMKGTNFGYGIDIVIITNDGTILTNPPGLV